MSVVEPSTAVEELLRSATTSVLIAAPYIKSATIKRLIRAIPVSVTEFVCITRWLPEDIASGACDLEILEDVIAVPGGKLLIQPRLHAKFFRVADQCLVGSANPTGRGLGFVTPANVELLVRLPIDFEGIADWEADLLRMTFPATTELRDSIKVKADELRAQGVQSSSPDIDQASDEQTAAALWTPTCPVPDKLWEIYCGNGDAKVVSSALTAGKQDLRALGVPQGLSKTLFKQYIASSLKQMPIVNTVDRLASAGLPDTEAHQLLGDSAAVNDGILVEKIWYIMKQWLTCFFPETFRVETGQEVLVKGQTLHKP